MIAADAWEPYHFGIPITRFHPPRCNSMHKWLCSTRVHRWLALLVLLTIAGTSRLLAQGGPPGGGGDSTPPTITFTPGTSTRYATPTLVMVEFCDNSTLNGATRTITFNGAAVSHSYVVNTKAGCAAYGYAQVTLALVPGPNTLSAHVCDSGANCITNTATYTYDNGADQTAPTVQITPATQTTSTASFYPAVTFCDERKLGTQHSVTLNGVVLSSWSYNTPAGTAGCNSKATMSGPVQLMSGVNTLTATVQDSAGNTGTQTVTWTYRPLVDTSPTNQWGVQRQLSDAVVTYSMPSYRSLDQDRGVTLVYSSFGARPTAMVQVDVTDNGSNPAPVTSLGLMWNGVMQTLPDGRTELHYATGAGTSRLTAVYGGASTPTRSMSMTAIVTRKWSGATEQTTAPVRVIVVNQKDSEFGAGWTVAGVERLYQGEGGILITHGDASATFYPSYTYCDPNKLCLYGHTPGDFGTMVYDSVNARYVRTSRDGLKSTFDALGYQTRVEDRIGNAQTYTYGSGRLATITDPAGLVTAFGYDGSGKLASITDPAGRVSYFQVNAAGDLASITDPDGGTALQLTYNTAHRVVSYTDRGARVTNVTYDAFGKLATVQGPAFTAEGGQPFRITSAVTSMEMAAEGNMSGGTLTAPLPRVDPATLRVSTTDPQGRITRYAVDSWGAPTRIEDPRGYVATVTRNAEGQTTATVDAKGNQTTYTWSMGDLTQATSPSGTVNYSYNGFGQLTTVWGATQPVFNWYNPTSGVLDSTVVAGTDTTRYTYDSRGRVWTVSDPEHHLSTFVYADTSRWKNVQSETAGDRETRYRYDAYGRVKTVTAPDGRETAYVFDLLNRQTSVTTPDAGQTVYGWGALFLNQVTDPRGQVFSWTRNALGQVEREVRPGDASGVNLTYEYDRYGRVSATTNRRGQRVSVTYDTWDRVGTRTADGQTATFSYSPDDPAHPTAPSWIAVATPESIDTIRVDGKGLTTDVVTVRTIGGIQQRYAIQPHYDGYNRIVGVGIGGPAGRDTIGYGYNATTFQLNGLRDMAGGVTSFGYNRDGQLATRSLPGGITITNQYTSTHMLGAIRYSYLPLDGAAGVAYEYDSMNRLIERRNPTNAQLRSYSYDLDGRWLSGYADFVQSGSSHPTCTWNANNGYDCDDPQAAWTATGSDAYTYDKTGNPLDHGAVTGAGNRLTQFNGYTLGYDGDGNLSSKTGTGFSQSFTWNSLGQLASVTTNGVTVSYGYNGFGKRIRKTVAGTDTHYLYLDDNLLMEITGNGIQARYTYYPGSSLPHSVVRGGSTYYYGTDAQGSVLSMFNAAGAVVNSYSYLPFGEAQSVSENPGVPNRIRYAGRELDTETGLYYNNARWYDPALHRFISQDPIGIDGGANPYAYTDNDPVNFVDPMGLTKCYQINEHTRVTFTNKDGTVEHIYTVRQIGYWCEDDSQPSDSPDARRRNAEFRDRNMKSAHRSWAADALEDQLNEQCNRAIRSTSLRAVVDGPTAVSLGQAIVARWAAGTFVSGFLSRTAAQSRALPSVAATTDALKVLGISLTTSTAVDGATAVNDGDPWYSAIPIVAYLYNARQEWKVCVNHEFNVNGN